jgi:hypothetical protein
MPVRAVHHQPLCADFNGNQLSDNVSYRMWLMRSGRHFEDEGALEPVQKRGPCRVRSRAKETFNTATSRAARCAEDWCLSATNTRLTSRAGSCFRTSGSS